MSGGPVPAPAHPAGRHPLDHRRSSLSRPPHRGLGADPADISTGSMSGGPVSAPHQASRLVIAGRRGNRSTTARRGVPPRHRRGPRERMGPWHGVPPSRTSPTTSRSTSSTPTSATRCESSFLEYAYSVIYSRALPDARDGLKPVQRRILYTMNDMGLRPDRGHVKSARVVGEVMGRLHPHGDGAIYDALVRHGAAVVDAAADGRRARQLRLARRLPRRDALHRVPDGAAGGGDDRLDRRGHRRLQAQLRQPRARAGRAPGGDPQPRGQRHHRHRGRHGHQHGAAQPGRGGPGAAAPDQPPEHRPRRPDAVHPRPRPARPAARSSASTASATPTRPAAAASGCGPPPGSRPSAARKGIVVTELPYGVGTEKVVERIKTLVQGKKLQGIADVKDLTDRANGLRLVIEVKNGFVPEAMLEQLYKQTPMEDSFGINNVALVDGQPRTLGLKQLLEVFLDHRYDVVRRRSTFRRDKKAERLHLVDGPADRAARHRRGHPGDPHQRRRRRRPGAADVGLRPLRGAGRLHPRHAAAPAHPVQPDRAREGAGDAAPRDRGARGDPRPTRSCCGRSSPTSWPRSPRPTARRAARSCSSRPAATVTAAAAPLEVADDPCFAYLSSSGLLARTVERRAGRGRRRPGQPRRRRLRRPHHRPRRGRRAHLPRPAGQARRARPARAARLGQRPQPAGRLPGQRAAVARARRAGARALHACATDGPGPRARHPPAAWSSGSTPRCSAGTSGRSSGSRTATRSSAPSSWPPATRRSASSPPTPSCCTSAPTRSGPQGRSGGGMAGVRLAAGERVVWFGALDPATTTVVVTASGSSTALPGTEPGAVKVTPFARVPRQGPRHRRRPLPPVPQGRGRAGLRLGRRRSGPRRGRQRRPGRPARGRPAGATAPASRAASRSPPAPARWQPDWPALDRVPVCKADARDRARRPAPPPAAGRACSCSASLLGGLSACSDDQGGGRRRSQPRGGAGRGQEDARRDQRGRRSRLTTDDLPDGVDRRQLGRRHRHPRAGVRGHHQVQRQRPARRRAGRSRSTARSTPSPAAPRLDRRSTRPTTARPTRPS